MATIKYRPNPAKPAKLTPEQEAFQAALTDEQITAIAEADPRQPAFDGG